MDRTHVAGLEVASLTASARPFGTSWFGWSRSCSRSNPQRLLCSSLPTRSTAVRYGRSCYAIWHSNMSGVRTSMSPSPRRHFQFSTSTIPNGRDSSRLSSSWRNGRAWQRRTGSLYVLHVCTSHVGERDFGHTRHCESLTAQAHAITSIVYMTTITWTTHDFRAMVRTAPQSLDWAVDRVGMSIHA